MTDHSVPHESQAGSPLEPSVKWLHLLVGPATHLAIGVKLPGGKKAYYPTPIRDDGDRSDLLKAHLAGSLPSRLCLRQEGGSFMAELPFALGYFTTRRLESRFLTNSITWDVDGPGHAEGLTAKQVEEQTWAIAAIAEEAGLMPTVVRSNSGAGRHVIVTLSDPIDAGLAAFIAQGVINLVPGAEKTEFFPRTSTLRDGQLGRLVALPLNGAAPGPGGGRIINRAGDELSAASVRITDGEAITDFIELYEMQKAADATTRAARKAEGKMLGDLAYASGSNEVYQMGTLEQVVRAVAEIADDRETESDIIGIRCPTHGGTCFHVNVDQGWFFCHKCGHKGAGPGAPAMLLRLLRPTWTSTEVRSELASLSAKASS